MQLANESDARVLSTVKVILQSKNLDEVNKFLKTSEWILLGCSTLGRKNPVYTLGKIKT